MQDNRPRNGDGARPNEGRDDEPGGLTVDVADERGARILRMSGELDFAVAPDLLPSVPEFVAGAAGLVLDLTAVTFFDSAGVRLVDRLARECGRTGARFSVVATPGTTLARVLDIVGFGPPMVVPDLAAGLAAVRDPR